MDAANRLSAISAEMGQLQNEIQERRRALNLFLRNVRARDPAEAERRMHWHCQREHKGFREEATSAAGGAGRSNCAGPQFTGRLE